MLGRNHKIAFSCYCTTPDKSYACPEGLTGACGVEHSPWHHSKLIMIVPFNCMLIAISGSGSYLNNQFSSWLIVNTYFQVYKFVLWKRKQVWKFSMKKVVDETTRNETKRNDAAKTLMLKNGGKTSPENHSIKRKSNYGTLTPVLMRWFLYSCLAIA